MKRDNKGRFVNVKEVLPAWVLGVLIGGWGLMVVQEVWMAKQVKMLSVPIESPYAVIITKTTDGIWHDRCQRAYLALKEHHATKAMNILDE
jgi:hypothetical protein